MSRFLATFLLSIFGMVGISAVQAAEFAYIRGATQPWGEVTNEAAMDLAFGAGNWDDLRMAAGPGPFLPGSGYRFLFLEGGEHTALELDAYLNANRAAIEAFVNAGGHLLLNAAPNEGVDIDFGFGGVTLDFQAGSGWFSDAVTAANAAHPAFVGPFTPVVTDYTATSFGHAIVTGGGLGAIILSNDMPPPPAAPTATRSSAAPNGGGSPPIGSVVLGEKAFGSGLVVLGGMTTDNFHDPQPEAANLRANILFHAANGSVVTGVPAISVPAVNRIGLLGLAFGFGLLAIGILRQRG